MILFNLKFIHLIIIMSLVNNILNIKTLTPTQSRHGGLRHGFRGTLPTPRRPPAYT